MKNVKQRLLDLKNLRFEVKDAMRYDDVGDYYGNTIVTYDMQDDIVNNAILIHEFIEYTLIRSAGLSSELIDLFDNDDDAPDKFPKEYKLYKKFHNMANKVERQFIENLGLSWKRHDNIIYTTPVTVAKAVQHITDTMHKHQNEVNDRKIEKAKHVVEESAEKKSS
jgi:hypothetical protein